MAKSMIRLVGDTGAEFVVTDSSGAVVQSFNGNAQVAKINDPAGGATVDTQARTAINAIIDALEAAGITAAT